MRHMLTPSGYERFRVANTEFVPAITVEHSTPAAFQLQMSAEAIEGFPTLRPVFKFRNVAQLTGPDIGSAALTCLVGAPSSMIALAIGPADTELLLEFARRRGIDDRVHARADLSIDEPETLCSTVEAILAGRALDVVVDDVSEDLATGVKAFEALFPLLAPGGSYVIDRWAWDHFFMDGFAGVPQADGSDPGRANRERFHASLRESKADVLERVLPALVGLARSAPEVVVSLTASKHFLVVERGPAALETGLFHLPVGGG
jgi:hypothetical protein